MSVLEHHVIPQFGSRELRSIRPSEVQAWVGSMVVSGLKPSTVGSYLRVLAAVMRSAVFDTLIVESPCRGVRLPRREVISHNQSAAITCGCSVNPLLRRCFVFQWFRSFGTGSRPYGCQD